jgi:hypothetical protein
MLTCSEANVKRVEEVVRGFGDLSAMNVGNVIYRSKMTQGDPDFEIWFNSKELLTGAHLTSDFEEAFSGALESQLAAEVVTA